MWFGNIEDLKNCALLSSEAKITIENFIKNNDLVNLPLGRHKLGLDNYVNVFEYETKTSDNVFEAHKEYIDVHFAIIGEETLLYGASYDEETKPYDSDGDYSLGVINNAKKVTVSRELSVFLPNEPHKAGVIANEATKIKKAVFKIKA